MYCCSNCFRDSEIKAIIQGHGKKKQKGNCDFCGSKKVVVYDIDKDDTLSEMFDGILDVYTQSPKTMIKLDWNFVSCSFCG